MHIKSDSLHDCLILSLFGELQNTKNEQLFDGECFIEVGKKGTKNMKIKK